MALTMVQIREYTEQDLNALRAIHAAQGFDYQLPDLRNPLFVTKLVLTGDAVSSVVVAQHAAPLQRPTHGGDDHPEGGSRDAEGTVPPGSIIGAALPAIDRGSLSPARPARR